MRLAVLSDIHGNLVALETVLADLEAQGGADLTWCLGDLAAFGSRPAECVRRIKALTEANEGKTFQTIGGNTDRYLLTGERYSQTLPKDADELTAHALFLNYRDVMLNWNLAQLNWDDFEFLKKINRRELHHEVEGYGGVIGYHAVPGDDEPILNPDTPEEQALDYVLDREARLGIGGHTHLPMNRVLGRWQLINVGSVGFATKQPGYAQYGIFTFEGDQVTVDLRSIPYDVEAVIADLDAAGHPVTAWYISRIRPVTEA
ncbi:MAG: metallophosphoesterase family protein [Armatimonadetes bacterium]|nr:metallophosphoesterase family protein [Anaerolineae bacterium]